MPFYTHPTRPDFEGWATHLCVLLELIELSADDTEKVKELVSQRFDIAAQHGITVTFHVSEHVSKELH